MKCLFSGWTPQKHNSLISLFAGFLFSGAWWMIIDVNVQHRSIMENSVVYHVPGIIGTLAMVCVNIIPYEILFGTYPYPTDGHCSPLTAKLFLFLSLMTSFGCLIAATYILINDFILSQSRYQWTGWGIFLQNLFIFVSCVLFRFARRSYF